jgi:hypothetical protein
MRFDETQLEKWIDTELSFLRYYGDRGDRQLLNLESDIYRDIRSIGYTKRVIPLPNRCAPVFIKSVKDITISSIDDLYVSGDPRMENNFTPCEIFIQLFPHRKYEIIDILKSNESNPSTKIKI